MLRQLRNNERGVVFITVTVILMVTMVLALSIVSMNISQTVVTESEVQRVQAEIIAQGASTLIFMNQMTASPGSSFPLWTETYGNTTFTIGGGVGADTGIDGTDTLDITVTY